MPALEPNVPNEVLVCVVAVAAAAGDGRGAGATAGGAGAFTACRGASVGLGAGLGLGAGAERLEKPLLLNPLDEEPEEPLPAATPVADRQAIRMSAIAPRRGRSSVLRMVVAFRWFEATSFLSNGTASTGNADTNCVARRLQASPRQSDSSAVKR
jgi:hypothetical protein